MTKKKISSAQNLMKSILGGAQRNQIDLGGEVSDNKDTTFSHIERNTKKKKTQMVTTMWVDPSKCRIQKRPNRFYELLTPERCADLISSMEGQGQQMPAIARQTGETDQPYEIIVGRRRHFAATYLAKDLLIDVRSATDQESFLLSEAENEGREDLSDLEKALDWEDALNAFFNGKVTRLAAAINKSRQVVYEYLDLASLDKKIVEAYNSPLDVKKGHAKKLISLMKKPGAKKRIIDRAVKLAEEKGSPGSVVFKELMKAGTEVTKRGGLLLDENVQGKNGTIAFNIKQNRHGKLTISINKKTNLNKSEIIELLDRKLNGIL